MTADKTMDKTPVAAIFTVRGKNTYGVVLGLDSLKGYGVDPVLFYPYHEGVGICCGLSFEPYVPSSKLKGVHDNDKKADEILKAFADYKNKKNEKKYRESI